MKNGNFSNSNQLGRLALLDVVMALSACGGPPTTKGPGAGLSLLKDYPTELPPSGAIPYGTKVLVNDGLCPTGYLKEVTGGSDSQGIPRRTRCVPIP